MGSHETGQTLIAGENNYANSITFIVASKPDPGGMFYQYHEYPSHTILHVTPDGDIGQRPIETTDGVTGVACLAGAGVRGLGGQVTIRSGGQNGSGTGGTGVVGHGGSGDLDSNDDPQFSVSGKTYDPGFGVVGIGGWWTGPQTASNPIGENRRDRDNRGGPGVVGVAGGENVSPPVPTFDQVKGVGVFGGSLVGEGIVADGALGFAGLRATGDIGVWGIGSVSFGVKGEGPTGVAANGKATGILATGGVAVQANGGGTGIIASGKGAPAAVFSREKQELMSEPQIHIEPLPMWVPDPQDANTVSVIPDDGLGDQLPKWANAGDLLMTKQGPTKDKPEVPARPEVTLWLCVLTSVSGDQPAVWKQVLLGPGIEGKNVGAG
jgi:hypothetical protein